jgi:hypothetical protein
MKRRLLISLTVAASAAILLAGYWSYTTYTTYTTYTSNRSWLPAANLPSANPPTATLTDPVEVFQKAFWKRPAAADTILHAERREWSDANGLTQWQWFIAVQPSPELVKHLREDNAFGLVPGTRWPELKDAPSWFSPGAESGQVLRSPSGSMLLWFRQSDGQLFATDAGGGFRPGAPVPAGAAAATALTTGRLPDGPPPNPLKP